MGFEDTGYCSWTAGSDTDWIRKERTEFDVWVVVVSTEPFLVGTSECQEWTTIIDLSRMSLIQRCGFVAKPSQVPTMKWRHRSAKSTHAQEFVDIGCPAHFGFSAVFALSRGMIVLGECRPHRGFHSRRQRLIK